MLRRSLRLLTNGYYDPNGVPIISYKETRVRSKSRKRRPAKIAVRDVPSEVSFDSSQENDMIYNENQWKHTLTQYGWIIIALPLFYGCTYLFSNPNSQPSESLVTLNTEDTLLNPGCKDQEQRSFELHEELLKLNKKLAYLLPSANLLPNFALESQGAMILHKMTSNTYQNKETCSWFGLPIRRPAVSPKIVIQGRSDQLPGQCWPFPGSKGRLSIALSHNAFTSHVSLSHIPKTVSPTGAISSAPKEFSVYGKKCLQDEETLLGTFQYDEDGDRIQTFKLPNHKADFFSYITLQVNSNWGHPEYTCLYGFRVHGKMADEMTKSNKNC